MPDRLQELLRQRALIQEHLAWIEREIDSARGGVPPLPRNSSPEIPAKLSSAIPSQANLAAPADSNLDVENIISRFRKDPGALKTDTRRGCLVFFGIAMALLCLGAIFAYWLYARHLGRWW